MCLLLLSLWKAEPLLNFRIWDVIPPTVPRWLCFPPRLSALFLQTGAERVTSEAPSHCFSCIEFVYVPIKYRAAVCVMRGISVPRHFVLCCSPQCSLCPLANWFPLSTLTRCQCGQCPHSVLILSPASSLGRLHCS